MLIRFRNNVLLVAVSPIKIKDSSVALRGTIEGLLLCFEKEIKLRIG